MALAQQKNYLLILIFLFCFPVYAEKPVAPVISVATNATHISIQWQPVNNSDSYQLVYAPFPFQGSNSIARIDIGNSHELATELWEDAAFYVAIIANNAEGSSHLSNIELFFLSTPILDPDALPITAGDWYKPEVSISWHWQLSGSINENYPVDLYDIDLFNTPAQQIANLKMSGKKVICYFSAGSYENFRTDKDKFHTGELGNFLDGWPNEQWLDIRTHNVANIMTSRLDLAALKGCDGVEPDNMDGYLNASGFNLTAADQLAFNKFIANEAHKRGLAVGLKNDLEQIELLVDFFDFSVNEQCHEFNECTLLKPFINQGKPVLNAEYLQNYISDTAARAGLCTQSLNLQLSSLILPLDLDDSFHFNCH
ncbi:MAG: hypothetical protein methR_P2418 [Methyloprofundus sp.]|nr:MAG: hypothetical protein methR_P2418 [Methyloprofundus sp.]